MLWRMACPKQGSLTGTQLCTMLPTGHGRMHWGRYAPVVHLTICHCSLPHTPWSESDAVLVHSFVWIPLMNSTVGCWGSLPRLFHSSVEISYSPWSDSFSFTLCTSHNCIPLTSVWWMVFTDIDETIIRTCIVNGKRPSLDDITGPADLVSFATTRIPLCWQQSPGQRPSFDGKHCCCCDIHDCHYVFLLF